MLNKKSITEDIGFFEFWIIKTPPRPEKKY